jgi:uncharacterized protein
MPHFSVQLPAAKIATTATSTFLIEVDAAARLTIFDYVGLKNHIAGLFDGPVDVVDRAALKPHLSAPLALDLVYAF